MKKCGVRLVTVLIAVMGLFLVSACRHNVYPSISAIDCPPNVRCIPIRQLAGIAPTGTGHDYFLMFERPTSGGLALNLNARQAGSSGQIAPVTQVYHLATAEEIAGDTGFKFFLDRFDSELFSRLTVDPAAVAEFKNYFSTRATRLTDMTYKAAADGSSGALTFLFEETRSGQKFNRTIDFLKSPVP